MPEREDGAAAGMAAWTLLTQMLLIFRRDGIMPARQANEIVEACLMNLEHQQAEMNERDPPTAELFRKARVPLEALAKALLQSKLPKQNM